MSAFHNTDGARGRKRRLGSDSERTEPPSRTSDAVQNGVPSSHFPRFSQPEQHKQKQPKQPRPPGRSLESSGGGSGGGSNGGEDAHDPYREDGDLLDTADLPNDTMATVLLLQQEFYGRRATAAGGAWAGHGGDRTGIVLQHQIYTVLENRTAVDLELTAMRKENILRTFRLGTGREDWGIMSTEHYLRVIHNLLGETRTPVQGPERSVNSARPGEDNGGASGSAVGDSGGRGGGGGLTAGRESAATGISATSDESLSLTRGVLERLVMSNTRAYASRKEVSKAMGEFLRDRRKDRGTAGGTEEGLGGGAGASAFADGRRRRGWSRSMRQRVEERRDEEDEEKHNLRSFKRKEAEVLSLTSELVRAGFLLPRRDVGREDAYWFSMPQLGKVIAAISQGRKDVMGALKRTRYKEMRRSALEAKNPAKKTRLPLGFHIRDLLGLGMIRELDTPSGMFLRLAPDA